MPLSINVEESRLVRQLDVLDHRRQFLHEVAKAILADNRGFESVMSIANRVYDRHCLSPSASRKRRHFDRPGTIALSA